MAPRRSGAAVAQPRRAGGGTVARTRSYDRWIASSLRPKSS